MLAISRRREETIIIKDDKGTTAKVKILEFKEDGFGQRVVLGISAPREWPVYREELADNLDLHAALRTAFNDAPEAVRKRFLAEVGGDLLARTMYDTLTRLMRALGQMGLVQVEQRPDGRTIFESAPGKSQAEAREPT